jgi:hypothetical protein
MNTDKNGWPYLLSVIAIITTACILMMVVESPWMQVVSLIAAVWIWNCVALFLTLAFSEELAVMPLYKKCIFSTFPLMYFSKSFRTWFLTEFEREKSCKQLPNAGQRKS